MKPHKEVAFNPEIAKRDHNPAPAKATLVKEMAPLNPKVQERFRQLGELKLPKGFPKNPNLPELGPYEYPQKTTYKGQYLDG